MQNPTVKHTKQIVLGLLCLVAFNTGFAQNILADRKAYYADESKKLVDVRFIYKNKKTGVKTEYSMAEIIAAKGNFYDENEFVDRVEPLPQKKRLPWYVALSFLDENNTDFTEQILSNTIGYQFVYVMMSVADLNAYNISTINAFAEQGQKEGIATVGLTHSDETTIQKVNKENPSLFKYYRCNDESAIAGTSTYNPGLILLKNGAIIQRWDARDLPNYTSVKENYLTK